MPHLLNRNQLLDVSRKEYKKLETYLATPTPEQMTIANALATTLPRSTWISFIYTATRICWM